MSTTTAGPRAPHIGVPFSTANKVGLVLAGLLGVLDLGALLNPTAPGEVGPPLGILVLDTLLGGVTVVAVVLAWRRRSRGMVRLAAGARILSMISALPAFFAGVPDALVALVAAFTVVTVATVVLMLLPARRAEV
ncbi:MAG: hypothetical protein AVDCRST_MAG48-3045 [uncultured Friedmanniella sp.]|uniref:Uncharacterized protein n=1 Tax=uncultured Friedmanniella sp. TaxID=335381 RepID=A0A6J4LDY1_9ACTN|nr:MAG: hypothetical protein AVDCRST_MAG48-3045 [uncultured Friedmanniella sp.]